MSRIACVDRRYLGGYITEIRNLLNFIIGLWDLVEPFGYMGWMMHCAPGCNNYSALQLVSPANPVRPLFPYGIKIVFGAGGFAAGAHQFAEGKLAKGARGK